MMASRLTVWADKIKRQLYIVSFIARDPGTPRLLRWLAIATVAYAVSPIDLIPDFIPVLGLLDDLILLPLAIALIVRFIPVDVIDRARASYHHVEGFSSCRPAVMLPVLLFWLLIGWSLMVWWLS